MEQLDAITDLSAPAIAGDGARSPLRQALRGTMRAAARAMSRGSAGENALAVALFDRMDRARAIVGTVVSRCHPGRAPAVWPAVVGDYRLGAPDGSLAVCTLSSLDLIHSLTGLPDVAITGRLYTVNSGIERMLLNLHANPRIRTLVLCGKDSPIFHTAQGVRALWRHGVTPEHRIVGARGHFPVLKHVSRDRIDEVRDRVTLVDLTGERETEVIADWLRRLGQGTDTIPSERVIRPPVAPTGISPADSAADQEAADDARGSGFFTVFADHGQGIILCQRYSAGHALLGEERASSANRIVRSLIRSGALDDLGHAAYLGGELAKAEAALRLRLRYEQDQPLTLA